MTHYVFHVYANYKRSEGFEFSVDTDDLQQAFNQAVAAGIAHYGKDFDGIDLVASDLLD